MIAEIAPGVFVATARQYTTTTTIVVGADGACLVIDAAVSVADLAGLAAWLAARGLRPAAGWSTHPHWDHLLWSRALGDADRYATPRAVAAIAKRQATLVREVNDEAPGHELPLFAKVRPLTAAAAAGGQAVPIDWPGPPALVYPHDAHAPGHGAVFLPDHGVLVAGDMCSDLEVPLPDLDAADPLGDYRGGLELLSGIDGVTTVVPGHGHVGGDPAEFRRRVAADHAYLDAVAAGSDPPDDRLTQDWLRAEHARALTWARAHLS